MSPDIIEKYIDRVYGYAVRRTYSRDEADELSQEILYTAIRELHKLRDDTRFEPWLWGIAENVTRSFSRTMGKQRAMFSYDIPESVAFQEECNEDDEELYERVRSEVAMLSAIYREIMIMFYYVRLTTKQISEKLGIPEGSVKWRLSEGRKKIKKELENMTETALKPVKMQISIYGSGCYDGKKIPFPGVYISDVLSQNILYYCYEKPLDIEEISKLCGVPAYYVEESVKNLLRREAVIEPTKGKYQTDFIIRSDKHGIYFEENEERILLPLLDRLADALDGITDEVGKIDFYKAGRSKEDLRYLLSIMAFSYASEKYCDLPYPPIKRSYDGGSWRYLGSIETGMHNPKGIGDQFNENVGNRGHYSHKSYKIDGMAWRPMMVSYYINVCEDILLSGSTEDVHSLSRAISDGYVKREEDGSLFVTVPAFTKEQKRQFDDIADKYLAPLMPEYCKAVNTEVSEYKKMFPKHLSDDVDRFTRRRFVDICAVVLEYAHKNGRISMPSPSQYCDVLVQWKE